MTTRPIFGSNPNPYRQPNMEMVAVKHNPWGRWGQVDFQRERDLLPNVNPDRDYGWLAVMEAGYDADFDAREKAKIMDLINTAKHGDTAEAVLALTALEVEYPDCYHALTKIKSDNPKHIVAERNARTAPLKKNIARKTSKNASVIELGRQSFEDVKKGSAGIYGWVKEKTSPDADLNTQLEREKVTEAIRKAQDKAETKLFKDAVK